MDIIYYFNICNNIFMILVYRNIVVMNAHKLPLKKIKYIYYFNLHNYFEIIIYKSSGRSEPRAASALRLTCPGGERAEGGEGGRERRSRGETYRGRSAGRGRGRKRRPGEWPHSSKG